MIQRSVVPMVTRVPEGKNFAECSMKFCTMRGTVYGPSCTKPPLEKALLMMSLNERSISANTSKISGSFSCSSRRAGILLNRGGGVAISASATWKNLIGQRPGVFYGLSFDALPGFAPVLLKSALLDKEVSFLYEYCPASVTHDVVIRRQ